MNSFRKRLAALALALSVIATGIPMQSVYAATESTDTAGTEVTNESEENSGATEESHRDEEIKPVGETQQKETDSSADEVQSAGKSDQLEEVQPEEVQVQAVQPEELTALLNYMVVESQYLVTPGTQNIVAEFGDENTSIQSATLKYRNNTTGEENQVDAQQILGNLVQFSIEHGQDTQAEIQIVSVTYKENDIETTLNLTDIGMDIRYGVNQEIETAPDDVILDEETAEAQDVDSPLDIVATDENGNVLSENSIQDILEQQESAKTGTSSPGTLNRVGASGNLVVVLDPGHDDTHAGARHNGIAEETAVLKIAQYCKAELEQYQGVTVYMTRSTGACPNGGGSVDSTTCNAKRVEFAQSVGANVYISFHLNSSTSSGVSGAGVYYPNSNYNPAIGAEGYGLASCIIDHLTTLGLSKWAGGLLIRNSEDNTTYPDGSLADYLGVIRRCKLAGIPAVLIEHAFVSNSNEVNQFLNSDEKLQKIGIADASAIAEYYRLSKGTSVKIQEATYIIKSAVDGNKVFDIASGSTSNGAALQIYDSNNSGAQRYEITNVGGNYYKIVCENSGKALTVSSGKTGTRIIQSDWNGSSGQKWEFYDAGYGQLYIQSALGNVIDLSNFSTQNGNQLQLYTKNNSAAQKWILQQTEYRAISDGTYIISCGLDNSKVIDIAAASIANQANVQLYAGNNSSAQRFEITYVGNGYYKIINEKSGKALDIKNGSTASGANVQQYSYNGSAAQLWKFVETSSGKYIVRSKTGNVLDVKNGSSANGTNIQVYTQNGSNAQQWNLVKSNDRPVADGTYSFVTAVDNGKVLDIAGGSTANGANIQIYGQNNSGAQRFKVTYVSGGYYSIISEGTGKSLDVAAASTAPGTNVQQYSYNGSAAQLWKFIDAGNGSYYLRSKTGNVLDLYAGNAKNGTNVQVYTLNESKTQKWKLKTRLAGESVQPFADGTYSFGSVNDGRMMDIYAGSMANGANVQTWDSNNSAAQRYELTYLGDGFYKIAVEGTGKVLEVSGASSANGANLHQYQWNGNDSQKWEFVKDSRGNYTIYSKLGTCIDVAGASKKNGANIQLYAYNGSNAQKWKVTKTEYRPISDGEYWLKSSLNTNRVIDIEGGGTQNGKNAQLYDLNDSAAQKFVVTYAGNGYYKITARHSGKVLDVYAGSAANGANVDQYAWNGTAAQLWKFVPAGNGRYYIKSKLGTTLDLPAGVSSNHTNIQTYSMNGSDAQKWCVEESMTRIAGTSATNWQQLVRYYQSNSSISYPAYYASTDAPNLETFCMIYIQECAAEGIKAEVAFAQAMKETGFLRYGGDVNITQNNFAGLGATGGGVAGESYPSVRIGIRAQVQHLKAYATTQPLKQACVDNRYNYVTKGCAVYVEWLGINENPIGKGWATAKNYGYSIRNDYLRKLLAS